MTMEKNLINFSNIKYIWDESYKCMQKITENSDLDEDTQTLYTVLLS